MLFLRPDFGSFGFLLIGSALYLLIDKYKKITRRGFFCEDTTIRYPYKPPTIAEWLVLSGCAGIPMGVIIVMGLWFLWRYRTVEQRRIRKTTRAWVVIITRHVLSYESGLITQMIVVMLAKKMVGSLRPYFFDICRPIVCNHTLESPHKFMVNFTCSTGDEYLEEKARLSFPSDYASTSSYAAIFCMMYIELRVYWGPEAMVIKTAIQWAFIGTATYVSLTGIADHHNNWLDIVGGLALGITFAVLWVLYVLDVRPDPISIHAFHDVRQSGMYAKRRIKILPKGTEKK